MTTVTMTISPARSGVQVSCLPLLPFPPDKPRVSLTLPRATLGTQATGSGDANGCKTESGRWNDNQVWFRDGVRSSSLSPQARRDQRSLCLSYPRGFIIPGRAMTSFPCPDAPLAPDLCDGRLWPTQWLSRAGRAKRGQSRDERAKPLPGCILPEWLSGSVRSSCQLREAEAQSKEARVVDISLAAHFPSTASVSCQ